MIRVIARETGEPRFWGCAHADTRTCPDRKAANRPADRTRLSPDEWPSDHGRHAAHATVCHSARDWAQDAEGSTSRPCLCLWPRTTPWFIPHAARPSCSAGCVPQTCECTLVTHKPKIFNASSINFNLQSSPYHDGVNPHGDYVNPRTFELAGCRAFQLVDHRTHLTDLFRVGEEAICFSTLAEARQLTSYYLSHATEREAIVARAHARALRDHTYEQRMQAMLEAGFQRERRRLTQRRNGENTAQHLLSKAGEDVELRQLLGKFQPQAGVGLETIIGQVKTGQGKLSDCELTFLFLQEFKKDLRPVP
jgi:hypothetical protein